MLTDLLMLAGNKYVEMGENDWMWLIELLMGWEYSIIGNNKLLSGDIMIMVKIK